VRVTPAGSSHKAISVNGRPVNIALFLVSPGDVVRCSAEKAKNQLAYWRFLGAGSTAVIRVLEVDAAKKEGVFKSCLDGVIVTTTSNENLIVELYSK